MEFLLNDPNISPEHLKGLALIVAFLTSGLLAKKLITDEAIDWRKFAGEWILAALGGIALWAVGMLQHFSLIQMVLVGTAAGLGGVRTMEWVVKLVVHIRSIQ